MLMLTAGHLLTCLLVSNLKGSTGASKGRLVVWTGDLLLNLWELRTKLKGSIRGSNHRRQLRTAHRLSCHWEMPTSLKGRIGGGQGRLMGGSLYRRPRSTSAVSWGPASLVLCNDVGAGFAQHTLQACLPRGRLSCCWCSPR